MINEQSSIVDERRRLDEREKIILDKEEKINKLMERVNESLMDDVRIMHEISIKVLDHKDDTPKAYKIAVYILATLLGLSILVSGACVGIDRWGYYWTDPTFTMDADLNAESSSDSNSSKSSSNINLNKAK